MVTALALQITHLLTLWHSLSGVVAASMLLSLVPASLRHRHLIIARDRDMAII